MEIWSDEDNKVDKVLNFIKNNIVSYDVTMENNIFNNDLTQVKTNSLTDKNDLQYGTNKIN